MLVFAGKEVASGDWAPRSINARTAGNHWAAGVDWRSTWDAAHRLGRLAIQLASPAPWLLAGVESAMVALSPASTATGRRAITPPNRHLDTGVCKSGCQRHLVLRRQHRWSLSVRRGACSCRAASSATGGRRPKVSSPCVRCWLRWGRRSIGTVQPSESLTRLRC